MRFPAMSHCGAYMIMAIFVAGLCGCSVGPDFVAPTPPSANGYGAETSAVGSGAPASGSSEQHFVLGGDVAGHWWSQFKSDKLDAFVAEAVAHHPDIGAAEAALRRANELAASDTSGLFPTIAPASELSRQRVSYATQNINQPGYGVTLYQLSAPISYTPDIWGGKARSIEADQAAADYQKFQLEAVYMTLIANVVSAAISDAAYAAEIRVTKDLIDGQRQQVELLNRQLKLGAASEADVLLQESQLAATLGTLPPLEKARAKGRDQLMAYLGRLPSEDKGEALDLAKLTLPADLPVSVPSVLVRQRPDIQSSEAQLHQASAEVGVALSNMLPKLTISGTGGTQANEFHELFSHNTSVWDIGANLTSPLFDAGALFHAKEARVAAFEQARFKYQSTVITAFQNVADALRSIKADADALKSQRLSETTAAKGLAVSRTQYDAGAGSYSNVLNAEQALLNARTNRVKAEALRLIDTVELFTALGGGWWNREDVTKAAEASAPGLSAIVEPVGAASDEIERLQHK